VALDYLSEIVPKVIQLQDAPLWNLVAVSRVSNPMYVLLFKYAILVQQLRVSGERQSMFA